ncbi:hypothetical protein HPB47_008609, partial [Ixodes persulcatus]
MGGEQWARKVFSYLYMRSIDTKWRQRTRKLRGKFLGYSGVTEEQVSVKKKVKATERDRWLEGMQTKKALEGYRLNKTVIAKESIYDNSRGSSLLFEARTGVLRTRTYRAKYQEMDTVCAACGEEDETAEHLILYCKGLHPMHTEDNIDLIRSLGFRDSEGNVDFKTEAPRKACMLCATPEALRYSAPMELHSALVMASQVSQLPAAVDSMLPSGTEVVARYNFNAKSREDLSFMKGDLMTIVSDTPDPNWFRAKHSDGREGLIPLNYILRRAEVKLNSMPWFHGKITREQAESLLSPREDGLFLVRESTNYPGDYTLCVCFRGKVEHYRVIYRENKLTIDEEEYFEGLPQLIEHYEQDADGLCTRLSQSVPKQDGEMAIDHRAFEMAGWAIKKQDLQVIENIGKGEFGDVLLANYKGLKVAVKKIKESGKNMLIAEASLMTSLRHPNLVQLLGLVIEESSLQIVTEYMAKGSLVDYLRSRGRLHVTRLDQINFATDTCAGMAYLESKHVVHRDLAARNVLISDDGVAKVSDFGLARDESDNLEGGKFPIKWTAPEALKFN